MDDVLLAATVCEAVLAVSGVLGISPGRGYIEATYLQYRSFLPAWTLP